MKITVIIPRTTPRRRLYPPDLSVRPPHILLSLHFSFESFTFYMLSYLHGSFKLSLAFSNLSSCSVLLLRC